MAQEKLLDDRRRVCKKDGQCRGSREDCETILSNEKEEIGEHFRVKGHGAQSVEEDHGTDPDLVRQRTKSTPLKVPQAHHDLKHIEHHIDP